MFVYPIKKRHDDLKSSCLGTLSLSTQQAGVTLRNEYASEARRFALPTEPVPR